MVAIEEVLEVEAAASSPSSVGDHHRWKYDVFLSFRGEDTRKTFVDHLYSALKNSGIYTFKDDERLETGESISPAILKAIEESSFAVIVFSKNYASSRWCLDELVKVMECNSKSSMGQTVIPVFYDIEPSDVRKQEGHFGEMFRKHNSDKVQIWIKALTDASNLSGLELNKTADGHESKFIDRIVEEIWSKLPSKIKVEDEGLVGMKSRIKEVTLLLGEESNVVRTVGIWGLSGIGKSTLARAVYRQIQDRFEVAYFLDEVGETSKKGGLRSLQQHLLSQTLGVKDLQVTNDMDGIALMKTRLRSRRVLLVIDDVDSSEQLEALAGSHEWFGPGSRIIITTRDRKLLVLHNVDKIHEVSVLGYVEATKLFCWEAFNDECPAKDFEELSVQVIEYSGRLPLALKVLGAALRYENLDCWKASLEKLRKVGLDGNLLKKLKVGFDGLEEVVQNTFLDIACFFEGWDRQHLSRILDSFDFYPDHSIPILLHKSLINYSNGRVCMHQLIREMGRHIVRQNFSREPGKYSRLWDTSDIEQVLTRGTGTENIEGILWYPHHILWGPHEGLYTIEMGTEAFRKMAKLRLLEIHYACIPRGPDYLPDELRWIDWDIYPSNYLPTTFEADFLVGLRLCYSRLKQLWEGRMKKLRNLKYVNLSDSLNLVGTSHLGEAYNLEELILQGCTSLVKADPSLGFLKKLVCLNLAGCENLVSLPEAIHWESLEVLNLSGCVKLQKFPEIRENMDKLMSLCLGETAIGELPSSIGHIPNLVWIDLRRCKNLVILPGTLCTLKRLKSLILSGCSKFKKLPEEIGNLECLEELLLDGTAVTEPPPSIGCLKNLKDLSFCKSSNLVLPLVWGLNSLTQLNLTDCNLSEGAIPVDLGSLVSLKELRLGGNNFENLPCLNQLSQLVVLEFNRCEMLRELPELPSRIYNLFANDCASLRVSVDRLAMCNIDVVWFQNCRKLLDYGENEIVASTLWQQKLQVTPRHYDLGMIENIILPGGVIPEWFCNHTFTGHSASLKLPQNWYYNPKFKGYGFFVILEVMNKCPFIKRVWSDEGHHRRDLIRSGLRCHGPITDLGAELSFTVPGRDHSMQKKAIFLRDTDNIIGQEHTIMGYRTLDPPKCCDCGFKECDGIEVGIRSLCPDAVVVKKWGLRVVLRDDDDERDYSYYNVVKTILSYEDVK
ncbi:hypothetical protein LguiA_007238 [Lonicera macranthoides]